MSERLHMPDALSVHNIRNAAVATSLAVLSFVGAGCQPTEGGIGDFTCYVPSAGGINGDNKDTAIGTKPMPDVDLAANIKHYYRDRATDDNGNGVISYEEMKNAARRNPVRVLIEGVGIRFIKDTGGDFMNAKPGRMDVSMRTLAACRAFMKFGRARKYVILSDVPAPELTPTSTPTS